MLTIPAPTQRDGIGRALADALGIDVTAVTLVRDELVIDVADDRKSEAQAVVDGHVPPTPVDHDAEFRKAVQAATSLDALKAALLGTSGPGAEPRRP